MMQNILVNFRPFRTDLKVDIHNIPISILKFENGYKVIPHCTYEEKNILGLNNEIFFYTEDGKYFVTPYSAKGFVEKIDLRIVK